MKQVLLNLIEDSAINHPILIQLVEHTFHLATQIDVYTSEKFTKWQLIALTILITYLACGFKHFLNDLDTSILVYCKKKLFKLAKRLPFLNSQIMKEINKTRHSLEEEILKSNKGNLFVQKLPANGLDEAKVLEKINKEYLALNDLEWENGAVSGRLINLFSKRLN